MAIRVKCRHCDSVNHFETCELEGGPQCRYCGAYLHVKKPRAGTGGERSASRQTPESTSSSNPNALTAVDLLAADRMLNSDSGATGSAQPPAPRHSEESFPPPARRSPRPQHQASADQGGHAWGIIITVASIVAGVIGVVADQASRSNTPTNTYRPTYTPPTYTPPSTHYRSPSVDEINRINAENRRRDHERINEILRNNGQQPPTRPGFPSNPTPAQPTFPGPSPYTPGR